nr:tRNA epoxyqueuosine(34) reductase QueG [Anaerolineae bacterium]
MTDQITTLITRKALEIGFSAVGIVDATQSPHFSAYLDWIVRAMHGEMTYMARKDRVERRRDPSIILEGAQSLICLSLHYPPSHFLPPGIRQDASHGLISSYAWGNDYHSIMQSHLSKLVDYIDQILTVPAQHKIYVDTGAILERSHASQARLGFVGKNTMLIDPQRGSCCFLGEIITTASLAPAYSCSQPLPDCGTCTRCLTACPTGAFPQPFVLDARRCISYLTIEYKGIIPYEFREQMGNWIFGCDICQEICPWQRFSPVGDTVCDSFMPPDIQRAAPNLSLLLGLNDDSFARMFAGTAIQRTGRAQLVRNACIAAGNSKDTSMRKWLIPLLHDPAPPVRAHAAWALGKLNCPPAPLREALEIEPDEDVREELKAAIASISPGM